MDPELPSNAPRQWRLWILPVASAVYIAAVAILFISNRYLTDRWWAATWMLYAPRWPWIVPALILGVLGRRRRRIWIPSIIAGLFVLGPFMGFNVPWHRMVSAKPAGQHVRLLSCNVHRGELDVPNLDAYILDLRPDVIVLQDYAGWDESAVLSVGWRTLRLRETFIASQFPITHVENLNLEAIAGDDDSDNPRYVGCAICFDLKTPGGLVHVVNVHVASPHKGLTTLIRKPGDGVRRLRNNMVRREKEAVKLSQYVASLDGPVILAGDFNMLSESPIYRQFFGQLGDGFATNGWGYGYTHFSRVSQLRLDRVLFTSQVECADFEIGPNCRTPHRPVLADLVIRGN